MNPQGPPPSVPPSSGPYPQGPYPQGPYPQGPYPQGPYPPPKKSSGCAVGAIIAVVAIVPILGIMAALAIYGVRRYLAAAKTSEARNSIGAIARAASAAYEREAGEHRLCSSGGDDHGPVPLTVPRGTRYQPSTREGEDFQTGDDTAGWKCLKFAITTPIYFQYHYNAEGGFQSPLRTGDGVFEAAARGDIDGDGQASLFSTSGEVRGDRVVLAPQIEIVDEFE